MKISALAKIPALGNFPTQAKNVAVAAQFATRQILEDPINLALNVARKLPHSAGQKVAATLVQLPGAGTQALGAQLQGSASLLPAAQELLQTHSAPLNPWKTLQRRVAAEVAISYGEVDYRDPNIAPAVRARTAWDRGDLSTAIEIARAGGKKALARKLAGEAQVLEPGWVPLSRTAPSSFSPSAEPLALHLLTNSLPHTQSGYTLRSHRLLTALQARVQKVLAMTRTGYPVLIGGIAAGAADEVDGLTYRRILPLRLGKTLPDRLNQTVEALAGAISPDQKPVLHTTTNYHNGVVMAGLAQSTGLPWVYEVRGIMEETWVSRKKTEADRAEAESSERFAKIRAKETELMLAADHVVTLSQTMKNLLVDRGVPAEKVTLLPNAVSDDLFEKSLAPEEARAELGLPEAGFWVGTVSSLVAYEGLDTLVRAVARLRAAGYDARLMIAGDGVARPGLEKLADELGISEYAYFLGKLPGIKAPLAHQALDAFCVPRTNDRVCQSVTPLKPIEAMALKRPVIMSNIPPLAELVDNGITGPTGLLVQPENPEELAHAIEQLMGSASQRETMAHNGREFARTRTWQKNAEVLNEIYRSIAREKETHE